MLASYSTSHVINYQTNFHFSARKIRKSHFPLLNALYRKFMQVKNGLIYGKQSGAAGEMCLLISVFARGSWMGWNGTCGYSAYSSAPT